MIATYVDKNGMIASPYSDVCLRLYDNAAGTWTLARDIEFTIHHDMKLLDVKAAVREAASQLEGCNIFLSAETRGLVHALLQE